MKVYLIRHAHAVPSHDGVPDAHRYLSADGRRTCREVGRVLREAGVRFDAVVTSPLVRAVQTAELLSDAVDYLGEIASHTAFSPGAHPDVACVELIRRGGAVALVGHAPDLSTLAARLIGRPGFAQFLPGQVALIEDRAPVWKLHPEALQLQDLHTA